MKMISKFLGEKMKKTISATVIALSGATSALALFAPQPIDAKTYCLETYQVLNDAGNPSGEIAGTCDESTNNGILQRPIQANGCAQGQVALTTYRYAFDGNQDFPITIGSCMPPNVTQL